jgi:hypothetical protein
LTDTQIADISAAKISGQIVSTQITDDSVTTAKIAANAVTAAEIAAGTITSAEIAAAAITATALASGAVTAGKIAAGTITSAEIAANTITTAKIAAGAVTASELAVGSVTAGKIAAGAIVAGDGVIGNAAIGTAHIVDAAITDAKIGSLSADKITSGTINAINITGTTITGSTFRTNYPDQYPFAQISTDPALPMYVIDNLGQMIFKLCSQRGSDDPILSIYGGTGGSYGSGVIFAKSISTATAIRGENTVSTGTGVRGVAEGGGASAGVRGEALTPTGMASSYGVMGYATGEGAVGVSGYGTVFDFKAVGPGANYGTFTGAHEGLFLTTAADVVAGDIVVDAAMFAHRNVSNTLTIVELSTTPKNASAIGVLIMRYPLNPLSAPEGIPYPWSEDWSEIYDVVIMNALGEGQINVCKDGGNIQAGDYVCSSSRPGKGMKQADDLHHNYTVAKAREDCIWLEGEDDIRMIACTYHCG